MEVVVPAGASSEVQVTVGLLEEGRPFATSAFLGPVGGPEVVGVGRLASPRPARRLDSLVVGGQVAMARVATVVAARPSTEASAGAAH